MNDKINMLLMTYSKYFPDESMMMIRDRFETTDESKTSMLYTSGRTHQNAFASKSFDR